MKALTKQHLQDRDVLSQRLQWTYLELQTEVQLYNEALAKEWAKVLRAHEVYQRVVENTREWCDNVATDIQQANQEWSEE